MKNILLIIISSIFLAGCVAENIEDFSRFTFQFPVNLQSTYYNRNVPNLSRDFSNLNTYQEYSDNRDRISKALAIQFNYWIDSLVKEDGEPYNPEIDDLSFEYVSYKLVFARPKHGNYFAADSADFEPDPNIEEFELGTFSNVELNKFYRNPSHILDVPRNISAKISEFLLTTPYFYVVSEYSKLTNQGNNKVKFPYMKTRFDIVVRFEVKV